MPEYHHVGHARVVAAVDPIEDRPGWLALRRAGIGGSDVAAICGQSPYKSALAVWLDKVGAIPDEQPDNERMFWGRILEPIIAEVMAERAGVELTELPVMLQHPEHEWMLASLDRAAYSQAFGPGVAEIKTAGYFAGADWADDQVPDSYKLQGQHYLAVTGLRYCLFGCLIAGQRLVIRNMERDDELIAHMVGIEAEFWQQVQEQRPPEPDGSEHTTALLASLWDVQPDLVVTMDPAEVGPLLERRARAARIEALAEARKRRVDNQLRWLLGEAVEARAPDGEKLFTWKADKNGKRTLRIPKKTTPTRKALEA